MQGFAQQASSCISRHSRPDGLSLTKRKLWVTMQAGAFRIGDTAGTLENIVACKLYRPGSVGFVSKSGGMSNEMYNVLSRATNGLYEGNTASQRRQLCHSVHCITRFQR